MAPQVPTLQPLAGSVRWRRANSRGSSPSATHFMIGDSRRPVDAIASGRNAVPQMAMSSSALQSGDAGDAAGILDVPRNSVNARDNASGVYPSPRPAEEIDHSSVECGDVVGLTARHEVAVGDDLVIHPFRARVLKIRLERRPRGDPSPPCSAGFDDGPRTVTDHRHRLVLVEESLREPDRLWQHPELVGVHDAARQQQGVEILRPGPVERKVDRKLLTPGFEIPGDHAFAFRRHDGGLGAGLIESFAGVDHLDLLEAVLDQDRNFQTFEGVIWHVEAPIPATHRNKPGSSPLVMMRRALLP